MLTPADSVLHYTDARLRQESAPVEGVDAAVVALVGHMRAVMAASDGLGLAAIQLGVPLRVVVTALPSPIGEAALVLVNPQIVRRSSETFASHEGCLSVPGGREDVDRHRRVEVAYLDLGGAARSVEVEGLASACLQHEIDHLNGVLYIDRLSSRRRRKLLADVAAMAVGDGVQACRE
jgi:peptide deformylase